MSFFYYRVDFTQIPEGTVLRESKCTRNDLAPGLGDFSVKGYENDFFIKLFCNLLEKQTASMIKNRLNLCIHKTP